MSIVPRCGVVLDIDGVLILDGAPIEGAASSLKKLVEHKFPMIFVTNGGGETEQARATRLSKQLDLEIDASQMILAHTPMRELSNEFSSRRILVLGRNKDKNNSIMEL
jgi:HAD superfamily hydrolase (TIGR01450 family)